MMLLSVRSAGLLLAGVVMAALEGSSFLYCISPPPSISCRADEGGTVTSVRTVLPVLNSRTSVPRAVVGYGSLAFVDGTHFYVPLLTDCAVTKYFLRVSRAHTFSKKVLSITPCN
jgi:hypothetical protein